MPDRTLHIGLDFDDTLMATRDVLVHLLNASRGTSYSVDECTDYTFAFPWNLTEDQFTAFFNQHEQRIHAQPPLDGLQQTLQAWSGQVALHVITGRPECWLPSAIRWLQRHNIQVEQILSSRSTGSKGAIARKLNLDFFIEDFVDFAREIADHGVPVLLLDRPYNKDLPHPLVQRAKNWHEIQKLAAQKWRLQTSVPQN